MSYVVELAATWWDAICVSPTAPRNLINTYHEQERSKIKDSDVEPKRKETISIYAVRISSYTLAPPTEPEVVWFPSEKAQRPKPPRWQRNF